MNKKPIEHYCKSFTNPVRFCTVEVKIGNCIIGGKNPIQIQSMANTATKNTTESVAQAIRIIYAGGDMIRYTASTIKEAQNLKQIKKELFSQGYNSPLVADVHFNPNAAEEAALHIEKVRINPGNFVDKKNSRKNFDEVFPIIETKFIHFLNICKQNNTAIRIGTNHGSLSERIMDKYGDTPKGMVEATMEFLRICKKQNFLNVVVSLKSSNTRVMVYAYRLLVLKMMQEQMRFPLHLGVTEAGDGEDGRIKSAVGIGALLLDGFGDTIRVSLTEPPENEIPVAKKLLSFLSLNRIDCKLPEIENYIIPAYDYQKRETNRILNIGGTNNPIVIADINDFSSLDFSNLGFDKINEKYIKTPASCDYIFCNEKSVKSIPADIGLIQDFEIWKNNKNTSGVFPYISVLQFFEYDFTQTDLVFIKVGFEILNNNNFERLISFTNIVFVLEFKTNNKLGEARIFVNHLILNKIKIPVICKSKNICSEIESFQIKSAAENGVFFLDGMAEGIWLQNNNFSTKSIIQTELGILQASRVRTYKTEYIACPSCGRTKFDIQKITNEIREKTNHLSGLKIGIMGCIVNGPGEMADADYGYVGTASGNVTLYKGKKVIKKNVPADVAVEELVLLIMKYGDWKDPK